MILIENFPEVMAQLEKERGIDKKTLIEALSMAMIAATKKKFGNVDNLEVVSQRQNTAHSKDKTKTSSKYIGVSWHKSTKKWQANINLKDKRIYLGLFKTEEDAHKAYQTKLKSINND
jgi:hypothetical protein